MHPVSFLKKNTKAIWWLLWLLFLLPGLQLIYQYDDQSLGVNPLQKLERTTGNLALLMLIITLSITPARHYLTKLCIKLNSKNGKRLADWNWLIRTRRMVGLYCFFYACIHVCIYISLDLTFEWDWFISDIQEKPYIIAGMISIILLIPLAITSTNKMMSRLGVNWRRIHKLIYVISITAIIHYWWLSKVGTYDPWLYTAIIFLLLIYRLFIKLGIINPNPADDGMEAKDVRKHYNEKRQNNSD